MLNQCQIEALEARQLMARFDLDQSFGVNGLAGDGLHVQKLLSEQADGKILALVDRHNDAYGENLDIARFNSNGTLDQSFGTGGYSDVGQTPISLMQGSKGKYYGVFTYYKHRSTYGDYPLPVSFVGVFRLHSNGAIDLTYGNKGFNSVQIATGYSFEFDLKYQSVLTSDDCVMVGISDRPRSGYPQNYKFVSEVLKFNTSGQLDTEWGRNGVYALPARYSGKQAERYSRSISSMIPQTDGSIFIAGTEKRYTYDSVDGYSSPAIFSYVNKLTPAGQLDATFSGDGEYKIANTELRDYDSAPVSILLLSNSNLLFSFRAYSRQQYFELKPNGTTQSKLNVSGEREPYSDYWFGLKYVSDTRLLRTNSAGIAEVRKLSDGRWETQPFYNKSKPAEGINGNLADPLLLKDKTILTMGSKRVGNEYENLFYKLSLGTGNEPRDDFIPNAQQNSFSFSVSGDYQTVANLFFFDAVTKQLGFRQRNIDGFWSKTQIVDSAPNTGVYLSAAGDAIAYTDGTNGDLKFAWRTRNGKFIIETVDSKGSTGLYPSMIKYDQGYAIAYFNRSRGDLMLAIRDSAGKWNIETVDSTGDTGRIPKLLQKSHNNKLAIAYASNSGSDVRLAEENVSTSARWTYQEVASTTGGVGHLDLEYEGYDFEFGPFSDTALSTYISYYDAGPADLVIAKRNGLGNKFNAYRLNMKGAAGLYPDVQDGGATLFYDRSKNRIRSAHLVTENQVTSVKLDDFIVVEGAGPHIGSSNYNSRYNLILTWYDTEKQGLKIRGTGWYQ